MAKKMVTGLCGMRMARKGHREITKTTKVRASGLCGIKMVRKSQREKELKQ